ncbi:DUF1572 family protein [Shouchella shacheensis]|uniref:DUF1572 family protein n=1 Tax=Shouchella shacheensis TaxID=1649580 RepID=UPI0007404380|nr:DUF1572 family protein [Shouchella shacheensis]
MVNDTDLAHEYIRVVRWRFEEMKATAEKAFAQVEDQKLFWYPNHESNSMAVIVQHMSGNMMSRWTDVLTTDGEKPNRNRDEEFELTIETREELYAAWNKGWTRLFHALDEVETKHLLQKVWIRKEPHSLMEAIERQMYHYSYHIGQIVYIAKQVLADDWASLTIPRSSK